MPVILTITIIILGLLGWVAKIFILKLWGNFQIIRFFSEATYGEVAMSKRHFLLMVFCWCIVIVSVGFPPFFALGLVIIALGMGRVFRRSSPEVAYRLAWYAFLMALVVVFTLVGFIALIFAMAGRREAIANENLQQLRQWDNFNSMNAINRLH